MRTWVTLTALAVVALIAMPAQAGPAPAGGPPRAFHYVQWTASGPASEDQDIQIVQGNVDWQDVQIGFKLIGPCNNLILLIVITAPAPIPFPDHTVYVGTLGCDGAPTADFNGFLGSDLVASGLPLITSIEARGSGTVNITFIGTPIAL